MTTTITVGICTPVPGLQETTLSAEWVIGLLRLCTTTLDGGVNIDTRFDESPGYDTARNNLARWAMDRELDWIFWLDSDTLVPGDAILRLLELDEPVCAALYATRKNDLAIVAHAPRRPIKGRFPLMTVPSTGMGAVLTKTNVFWELRANVPDYVEMGGTEWPSMVRFRYGDRCRFFCTMTLPDRTLVSEDKWFYNLLADYTSHRVVIDPTIEVRHYGTGFSVQRDGSMQWTRSGLQQKYEHVHEGVPLDTVGGTSDGDV